ncbi:MAG: 30S ribosomal protein S25e [Thermoprotei archaeon]|nr:MAG: 30S ribosomal protein S25e [Thermoprotei archaeon]
MGGKKKPTISQLEKRMKVLSKRQEGRRRREKAAREAKLDLKLPTLDVPVDTIAREVVKMRCITPYAVATKYNIKISLAKKVLRELAQRNIIRLVDRNRRVEIYVPAAA